MDVRNECFLRWPFVSKIEINEVGKSADNWPFSKKLIGAKCGKRAQNS